MWRFYWVYNPALLRFSLFHLLGPLLSLRFKFLSSLYLLNPSLSTFCPNWVYLHRRFFLYLSEVSEVLWTYHGWLCSISGYWQLECCVGVWDKIIVDRGSFFYIVFFFFFVRWAFLYSSIYFFFFLFWERNILFSERRYQMILNLGKFKRNCSDPCSVNILCHRTV